MRVFRASACEYSPIEQAHATLHTTEQSYRMVKCGGRATAEAWLDGTSPNSS